MGSRSTRGGGGAATQAGTDYQNRVAAWIAVHILAEQAASPPWDLPANVTLDFLHCETDQPVDDVLVGTSVFGFVFIQAKHALSLETSSNSELASTLGQFVRQYLAYRDNLGRQPWERPPAAHRDRLVLATGPRSSSPIRRHLPSLLHRLRGLVPEQTVDAAALTGAERRVLQTVTAHLASIWQRVAGQAITDDDTRQLLSLIQIHVLDVDQGGVDEQAAKNLLRAAVLQDPAQADIAWHRLIQACAGYGSNRSGADRAGLRQLLVDAGIHLQAPRSYFEDIRRLREYTRSTLDALAPVSKIYVGRTEVKITRRSTVELRRVAEGGSLLVIGDPGAGKSGALRDFAEELLRGGYDVVFLAVDRTEAPSLGALRQDIGLSHDLVDVLENWSGDQPAFLVIDALDAARSEQTARTIREIIVRVAKGDIRWRVIASIRKFDLRYNPSIQQIFMGTPSTEFWDTEFAQVRHINIPILEKGELEQIRAQSPQLGSLVSNAPPALWEMLQVLFNLRLIAELLGTGIPEEQLTPVRTQVELLDKYWLYRVIRSDGQGDVREAVLRRVASDMVSTLTLHVSRPEIVESSASAALADLLSTRVLSEWQPSPASAPNRYIVTFTHHFLFDYAVARDTVSRSGVKAGSTRTKETRHSTRAGFEPA